jgi:TRAP-type C4-dicarboxylate transport system permease small subunit
VLQKIIDACCRLLAYLIGALLAAMVVMVFGNVVMRYAFNSGFSVSEELSRWMFVWLVFMGAVVVQRERGHLGTDMVVSRLGSKGKRIAMGLSLLLMLFCTWLVFKGSYEQTLINWETTSAVMEVSVSYFYASGVAFSVLVGVILLNDLWRLLSGQVGEADLSLMQGSEESAHDQPDAKA